MRHKKVYNDISDESLRFAVDNYAAIEGEELNDSDMTSHILEDIKYKIVYYTQKAKKLEYLQKKIEENKENIIQILEDWVDNPFRYCVDYPLNTEEAKDE